VSKKFVAAAEAYRGNPEALNLRAMNMVYDAMKARGSMVLLPSNALQNMNLGSGTASLARAGLPSRHGRSGRKHRNRSRSGRHHPAWIRDRRHTRGGLI
jgi:hypothetical protein